MVQAQDTGASAVADQATHEQNPQAVSAADAVGIPSACRNCARSGWVCENHQDRPWGGSSSDAGSCECGAGAPCPVCSRDLANLPYLSDAIVALALEAFRGGLIDVPDLSNSRGYTTMYLPEKAMRHALAHAIDARRAETAGSDHESVVPAGNAPQVSALTPPDDQEGEGDA